MDQTKDDYQERYVAFLDLLGFTTQVERADHDPEKRKLIREVLHLVRDTLCENPNTGMRLTYFSDCLVVSTDRTQSGLADMLMSISTLTLNLLQYDVLLRGGLTAGGAHHDKNFVYGTAMNRAYQIESGRAEHPRTLLSKEVIEDAGNYNATFAEFLLRDGPDSYFIDYLKSYKDYRPTPIYNGMVVLDRPAARVIQFVSQRLKHDTGRVLAKAEWLRDYWNNSVAPAGVFPKIDSSIPTNDDLGGPTIIVRRLLATSYSGM